MIINEERAPTYSLYYLGAMCLRILQEKNCLPVNDLFADFKSVLKEDINVDFFYYALDWLYVISLIDIRDGRVCLLID